MAVIVAVLTVLASSAASAFDARESILVYRNLFTFKVNGQVVPTDNFVLDNEPYIPLSKAAEALGLDFAWDAKVRVATVASQPAGAKTSALQSKVDPYNPTFDLISLGLTAGQVDAVALETAGSIVPKLFRFEGNKLIFTGDVAGLPVLELNTPYTLKVYGRKGTNCRVRFSTSGLPDLTSDGQRRIVLVPAMPDKGFYWPYFLVLPSNRYKDANQGHKRYLVVDTSNTGTDNSVESMISATRQMIDPPTQTSMHVAEELWSPFLMPAFPRPSVSYYDGTQWRTLSPTPWTATRPSCTWILRTPRWQEVPRGPSARRGSRPRACCTWTGNWRP